MKTKLANIIGGLFMLLASIALISFGVAYLISPESLPKRQTTEVQVIWDVTEAHEPVPQAAEILPLFGLDDDDRNGAIFRFTYASDVSLNRETVFMLRPTGYDFMTNQFDREREVEKFREQITAFLDSVTADTIGRERSAVYLPMAKAVNDLAGISSADRKVLLMYSDLRENTERLSFYNAKTMALLENDSVRISSTLLEFFPLADLSGIEVHLLYAPRDATDDTSYRIIAAFYTGLLQSKGARVFVSANLPREGTAK